MLVRNTRKGIYQILNALCVHGPGFFSSAIFGDKRNFRLILLIRYFNDFVSKVARAETE